MQTRGKHSCQIAWISIVGLVLIGINIGARAQEIDTLRLAIKTGSTTELEAVTETVKGFFNGDVRVERLFEEVDRKDDVEALAEMFLAFVPTRTGQQADTPNAWNIAYDFRDESDYEYVVPDLPDALEPAMSSTQSGCRVDDPSQAPPDKTWSLDNMYVRQAWNVVPSVPDGRRRGEGILVCHPDTGWADHKDLDQTRLDLSRARNLLSDGEPDAEDPLDYSGDWLHPGHGAACLGGRA
ncbi:MAG: hypothetical protein U9R74_08965 [Pseudomonadota bacterium]|nr:hypothetical protein [Pseudomonadota bacterium]